MLTPDAFSVNIDFASEVEIKPTAGTDYAGVAQLAEQLICNQQVAGSSPIAGSRIKSSDVSRRT